MTLMEFLTARLDEDEAAAGATYPRGDVEPETYFALVKLSERTPHESRCGWRLGEGLDDTCECHYPARVLREVEAKRRVISLHRGPFNGHQDCCGRDDEGCRTCGEWAQWPCPTIRALASVHNDHPDYRAEWS